MQLFIRTSFFIHAACKLLKFVTIFVVFLHVSASVANATNQYVHYGKKVTICHNASSNPRTIRIRESQLDEYLSRGDYKGRCKIEVDVKKIQDINFGSLITESNGFVKLDPKSGTRTSSGGVFLMEGNYEFARYIVRGTPHAKYYINLPRSASIQTSNGDNLKIRRLISFPERVGKLNANGEQEIIVGGVLKVRKRTDSGNYSGSFNIDVKAKN